MQKKKKRKAFDKIQHYHDKNTQSRNRKNFFDMKRNFMKNPQLKN